MGGSGGSGFYRHSPEKIKERIRKSETDAANTSFDTELSGMLNQQLAAFNDRNAELVRERLEKILKYLEKEIEGTLDTLLGGSIAKHTYVDGLSDIDSLLLVNDSELLKSAPSKALEHISSILKTYLPSDIKISSGNLAVTVEYQDGLQIQLLPAIRTENGFKIASSNGTRWSEVDPKGFTQALTKYNAQCGNKLVPTIKIIKAINAQFPEKLQLSGYHIESLAIEAFKKYDGPKTLVNMLPHFFDRAKELVLSPIKDKTGQSIHVDEYLGDGNSNERILVGHLFNRISKRMQNASAAGSIEQWQSILGE